MRGDVDAFAAAVLRRSALARTLARPVIQARGRARDRKQLERVRRELANSTARNAFASGDPLPDGFGIGANERIVEIPWLLAQGPAGTMLDAGSALNHIPYLDAVLPRLSTLHIVTLVYEGSAYPERGISYIFSDLRDLPYPQDFFDTVASVSTLEHVGMDNSGYGSPVPRADDPGKEAELAVRELVRVLKPGGLLLVTVPYGRREDHGGLRQFDREDVERLRDAAAPAQSSVSVYRYSELGWQLSDPERAADARYRIGFAAEAVACLRMIC